MVPTPPEGNSSEDNLSEPLLRPDSSDSLAPQQLDNQNEAEEEPAHDSQNEEVSRNVHLTLWYTCFAFAGRSIWNQSVLATYVFLLRHNDLEAVGFITATMGLAQFACSIPTGWLADSYRRDTMLKIASCVGWLAIGVTLYALWTLSYIHLVASLATWGVVWGISNTSLSALFADSIPQGSRSFYFTRRSMILTTGNIVGPLVSLTMFALLGDEWTICECAIVIGVGQIICFPAVLLLCFFNDDFAVQAEEQLDQTNHENESNCQDRGNATNLSTDEETMAINHGQVESDSGCVFSICKDLSEERKIALLIASADLTAGLASGMSIRYFPIFFKEHLHLGPIMVQVLYILAPACQTCLMRLGQWLSGTHGRVHVSAVFKCMGVSLMFAMILAYRAGLPSWITCLFFVFRTGCANATSPLTRSVLMDNVPKHERAKWASLESLNMFSWSGSAALGGVLAGVLGMLNLFAITATLQLVGTIPLVLLFSKDTQEGGQGQNAATDVEGDEESGEDDSARRHR